MTPPGKRWQTSAFLTLKVLFVAMWYLSDLLNYEHFNQKEVQKQRTAEFKSIFMAVCSTLNFSVLLQ